MLKWWAISFNGDILLMTPQTRDVLSHDESLDDTECKGLAIMKILLCKFYNFGQDELRLTHIFVISVM